LDGAERSARARRAAIPNDALAGIIAFRRALPAATASACMATEIQRLTRDSGPTDFGRRQQFKILSDCAMRDDSDRGRALALSAFTLADTTRQLIGIADVRRLERVMIRLLRPVGISVGSNHVDADTPAPAERFSVYLSTETTPRWLRVALDDLLAVRAIGVLGVTSAFRLQVLNGDVTIQTMGQPPAEAALARLRSLQGVKTVRVAQLVTS
ncbi:MAG: hypothetical protein WEE89_17695, partial [Gemmatimonadota bacterium]